MTKAKRVLDTSCGWGDRLAGFFSSSAEEYYGCDQTLTHINNI